jgi:hypothetical protein
VVDSEDGVNASIGMCIGGWWLVATLEKLDEEQSGEWENSLHKF